MFNPECDYIKNAVCVYSKSLKCGNLVFRKADRFFSPTSISTVQHSLNNADTRMPPMQNCLQSLIDPTTRHYNSTCMHSTSLWLAFLMHICCAGMHICCAQQQEYALVHLPEIYRKLPKHEHLYIPDMQW